MSKETRNMTAATAATAATHSCYTLRQLWRETRNVPKDTHEKTERGLLHT
jgi:hypothetical protein